MTRVVLPTASLIPEEIEKELRTVVGEKYAGLDELDRVILMIAHRFGAIGNSDIQPYRSEQKVPDSEHLATDSEHFATLREIAAPIRETGRAPKQLVRRVLLELCRRDFLTLRTLAELLNRSPDSIRNHYLTPMLSERLIELRFSDMPPMTACSSASGPIASW